VLLKIDPERVNTRVRYEEVPGGERFSHIYGPVPTSAVISATPVPAGEDGRLSLDSSG
jgi:uncharacterized protein (DUF952 family)